VAAVLRHYLGEAARRGFAWGEHDCILFAAGWVREVCGQDPARQWRRRYADEASAKACLEQAGGMLQAIEGAIVPLGWRRMQPEAISAGDVALIDLPGHDGKEAVGIVAGRRKVALLTRRGLVVAPVPVLAAWRYGGRHG
jgi:hypothetical protein